MPLQTKNFVKGCLKNSIFCDEKANCLNYRERERGSPLSLTNDMLSVSRPISSVPANRANNLMCLLIIFINKPLDNCWKLEYTNFVNEKNYQ